MSKEYELEIWGQPSLYKHKERKFKIFFSEPENGVNEETGILLLISGYGENPNSNVYKKCRNTFADKYNLVTLQCEYFGCEFMQSMKIMNADDLQKYIPYAELEDIFANKNHVYEKIVNIPLNEALENMNDMGPLQAIDNITATISPIEILKSNNLKFNKNKIIIYGFSHGAYLAHLCNLFSPSLFSTIIDNSGYVYPAYLEKNLTRTLYMTIDKFTTIKLHYRYIITDIVFDKQLYNLNILYNQLKNKCHIISFQGNADNLYDYRKKVNFIKTVDNTTLELITEKEVDGAIFKSNTHGLNADYLKLFEYVYNKYNLSNKETSLKFSNIKYKTDNYTYNIIYTKGVPCLTYSHN